MFRALNRLVTFLLFGALALPAAAGTPFGPSAYLQTGDTPSGFFSAASEWWLEDFEDNALDPFLSIDHGDILLPNSFSGLTEPVTDSVDGDDGSVDGNGNAGHSWYAEAHRTITVTFEAPVRSAALVFTDGDKVSSDITLEAHRDTTSLGLLAAGDLADDFFTGETPEDRFLGFQCEDGITSITISMNAGVGMEIDHIQWQLVPEPASWSLVLLGLLGIAGLRRKR